MRPTLLLSALLLPVLAVATDKPSFIFENPADANDFNIPTSYESAVMARRVLHLTTLGTLSTVFPKSHTNENRPDDLGGVPIGLMDYIADCEDGGNPTILALNIATSFKNVAAGSNITLSMQWIPPHPPSSRIKSSEALPFSAANLPRFSLIGYLERIPQSDVESKSIRNCFVKNHPDARYWTPGNMIHESWWARLVVEQVYWIGGFGDRAYSA